MIFGKKSGIFLAKPIVDDRRSAFSQQLFFETSFTECLANLEDLDSKIPRSGKTGTGYIVHSRYLELFGASLEELRKIWENDLRPKMPVKTAKRAITTGMELFGNVTDVIRDAARIPQDRNLQAENIRAAILYGLEEIFEDTAPPS